MIRLRVSPMEKHELETAAKRRNTTLSGLILGAALGVAYVASEEFVKGMRGEE